MSLQNLRFSIRRPHPGHFLVVFCSNSKVAGSFSFSWNCLHVKPSCHKILHLKQLLALHFWHSHRGAVSAVQLAYLLPALLDTGERTSRRMQLAPTTDATLVSLLAPPVRRLGFQQVIHHE